MGVLLKEDEGGKYRRRWEEVEGREWWSTRSDRRNEKMRAPRECGGR